MSQIRALGGDVEEALDRVKVPSYLIDEHGIIRWVNPAAQALVGDVRGRQFTSVVAPEDTHRARQAFARHMIGTEDIDAPVVLLEEDGGRVSVEVSSVCLFRGHRDVGVFGQLSNVEVDLDPPPHGDVTPRQAEVLRLLEHGRSTEQIAAKLHLSPETVRNHIRALFRTLGVHSRLEAVAVARRQHLVAS
ncbi:MAG TPA: LuxR C-terminal-related transcriptional regulator [Candidatus Acidoferrum sp.]|nr:LuxR C-terminal-related transcriptional regulator [Candidatus Acidoferrum sp.]